MKTTIISVAQAIADGNYKWNQGENDTEYRGWMPGYAVGVCMEMKKSDGSIYYADCVFIDNEEEMLEFEEPNGEWNPNSLTRMADYVNDVVGAKSTGRLVFRGYFDEVWIPEEREYGYQDASKDVEEMFSKYCIN